MEIRDDDVIYLVAMRARGPNRGQAVRDVIKVLSLARPSGATGRDVAADAYAAVAATSLRDSYSLKCNERDEAPRQVQNLNDVLNAAGFTFDEANNVVPVVTAAPAPPTQKA